MVRLLRMYSAHLTSLASTEEQEIFDKQWPVPVTLKAIKIETDLVLNAGLVVRGLIDGEVFLQASDAAVLEEPNWIPVGAGPAKENGHVRIECDETGAATPDVKAILLIDVGKTPPNNLPWIYGAYATGDTSDPLWTKQFAKAAQLSWVYMLSSAGTYCLRIGGAHIQGDDSGYIDEPTTPPDGIAYPYAIPANVAFDAETVGSTICSVVKVDKPR